MLIMKRYIKILPLLLLLIVQFFCSSEVSDTTSSSEVKNGIMGTIINNGLPVENSIVILIKTDNWKEDILANSLHMDTIFTDPNGFFNFVNVDSGKYTVFAEDTIFSALRRNVYPTQNGNLQNIELTKTSTIRGKISSEGGIIDKLYIKDTHFNITPDSLNKFEFADIPSDSTTIYTLITGNEQSLNYTTGHHLIPDSEIDKNHIQAIVDGFLLDNFDDGDRISNLDWFSKQAKWYAYTDDNNGGNTQIVPSTAVDDITTTYSTDSSFEGNSLTVKFILGDAIPGPYASVACSLGVPGKEYVSLEDMTQLAFMIKGSGTIRVNFITEYVDLNHSGIYRGDFGKTIAITSEWTQHRINISDLLPEPDTKIESDGIKWEDVSSSVRALVFGSWSNAGDTVDLSIDNIRLYGIDPEIYGND